MMVFYFDGLEIKLVLDELNMETGELSLMGKHRNANSTNPLFNSNLYLYLYYYYYINITT
jgi:hypothetical protein